MERYEEKGEELRAQARNWKANNRERISEYNKQYYQEYYSIKENKEHKLRNQRTYNKKYRKTEAGKAVNRRSQSKRRARLAGTFSEQIPDSFYEVLRQKQNNQCRYCGISFDEEPWTEEHVTPLSKKGPHIRGNLSLACVSCNSSKWDKTHDEFLEYLGG